MPEALALFAVLIIAVTVYVVAWVQSRDSAHDCPREELLRLRQQQQWLQQRVELAKRENWPYEMADVISNDLGAVTEQISKTQDSLRLG